jgi:hypothetical protein
MIIKKEIPSYNGYAADSEGNVWSTKLNIIMKHDTRGRVNLNINKRKIYVHAHLLVYEAFFGKPKSVNVIHKDGNKKNNRPENLECLIVSELT